MVIHSRGCVDHCYHYIGCMNDYLVMTVCVLYNGNSGPFDRVFQGTYLDVIVAVLDDVMDGG